MVGDFHNSFSQCSEHSPCKIKTHHSEKIAVVLCSLTVWLCIGHDPLIMTSGEVRTGMSSCIVFSCFSAFLLRHSPFLFGKLVWVCHHKLLTENDTGCTPPPHLTVGYLFL
uniref:Uncharacterized protein n=1 Tax=Pyxicephalus adspersus TaxID=30357 RepID=A0AAV2ZIN3_PYXAD|nr:TPA: hypothetical protein GDO54_017103 [Pyxicephalus adspersus]